MELQLQELNKQYGTKCAVNNVSATLTSGVYGLLGANGAGKTTLMRMICGVLKPTSGSIRLNGKSIGELGERYYTHLGYMPQDFGFYPDFTAREFMMYMAAVKGLDKRQAVSRTEDLLNMVNLKDVADKKIKSYSGGMKQRLGIAQALLNRPKLLICDEPTSALDPVGRKEILDILLAIREQTTVLFSTHILSDVERICTDVAFLNNGVVGVQGKLSDIKTRYRSEEYQLETGNDTDMLILQQTFPNMQQIGRNQLVFCEGDYTVFDILRFIADKHIALLKLERAEPTLESLFMEVVEK